MQYVEDGSIKLLGPTGATDPDLVKYIANANKYFYEDISSKFPIINKLDFYSKYGVERNPSITIGVPHGTIGVLEGKDNSLWLLSLTDVLYVCCVLYKNNRFGTEYLQPAKYYLSNHRHLLLTIVQSTRYIRHFKKDGGVLLFASTYCRPDIRKVVEYINSNREDVITVVAKNIFEIIMSETEKYKKYSEDNYKKIDGYYSISGKAINLFTGQDNMVKDETGDFTVDVTLSFAYDKAWGYRSQLFFYKQYGMNKDVILIDRIVVDLFKKYSIPHECEFLATEPIIFKYKMINAMDVKFNATVDESCITDVHMGDASIHLLYNHVINCDSLYLVYTENSRFYDFIWKTLTEECNAWIMADNRLTGVCTGNITKIIASFIEYAWTKSHSINNKELLAEICRTVLSINKNDGSCDAYSKIKLLLIRVYFFKLIAKKQVKLLLPSSASIYKLEVKDKQQDLVSGSGYRKRIGKY